MLKIKQRKWRRWVRFFLKIITVSGFFYLLFGVLFGIRRGAGSADGDLILFCRTCRNYNIGDVLLMDDGTAIEYSEVHEGVVSGKIIAKLSVRGFMDEGSE